MPDALLRRKGYQTAAVISSYPLNRKFGYGHGFETFDQAFTEADATIPPVEMGRTAPDPALRPVGSAVTREAVQWLGRRQPGRPFFLCVHYFDPHSPYDAPEPSARALPPPTPRRARSPATSFPTTPRSAFADAQLSRLLDAVKTDHGEGPLTHEAKEHGEEIYEEARAVSFIEHPFALAQNKGSYKWHAGAPDDDSFTRAWEELAGRVRTEMARHGLGEPVIEDVAPEQTPPSGVKQRVRRGRVW